MEQTPDKAAIIAELDQLRERTAADFSAVAVLDPRDNRIRWNYASGQTSNRLHLMTKKPGIGIVGQIIRYGRSVVLDASAPELEESRHRYPVMLAEKLASVMAVPIPGEQSSIGVLLAGNREMRRYTEDQLELLHEAALRLAKQLK